MPPKTDESPAETTPIVAIGASAGGLEALSTFFSALPDAPGAAFVVVMHLAPAHHSELAAILGRQTCMPTTEVSERVPLERNHVYVIPPNRQLELTDSEVSATPFGTPLERRAAVDLLFRSLAERRGNGFAIILSGGGSDGAVGVKAVKEHGGIILVQDPAEAGFDSMPRAAIATGIADLVLPARELATRLCDLIQGREIIQTRLAVPEALESDEQAVLGRIISYLNVRTGHDFSHYKRSTVLRRVARRMQVHRLETLEQYLAFLKETPEEAQGLFQDLLISVTAFFRDAPAWDALRRRVIPKLFDARAPESPLRVWVPGCATGEEAYSLAMLLLEEAGRRPTPPEIQVFASDLDERALAVAREGIYGVAIEADVTAQRLSRFFIRDDDLYHVDGTLRDLILFARHSLMRDPPFARQDLISCRNLLIYLDRELQTQVFGILRYALRPGGYLFLGISEHAEGEYFRVIDKQHHIYQAREISGRALPLLPDMLTTPPPPAQQLAEPGRGGHKPQTRSGVHRTLLEELGPPSVLVDGQRNAVHLSETAGRYLQPPEGAPTQDVTLLVRRELQAELSAALYAAFDKGEASLSGFVPVQFNGTPRSVAVLVQPRPARDGQERLALIVFLEAGEATPPADLVREETDASTLLARRLKEELRSTRTRLHTAREEFEAGNEELRAANEELQSLNEEYRSTAEELETSKEELQSINEELNTVNGELKNKLEEVSRAHNDLENLMTATEIPTLFLDRELCIKRFTPQVADLFSIKSSDQERPIRDLNRRLDYDALEADAANVLRHLTPLEREVTTDDDRWYLARLRPYRTADHHIDGVVATFVDFTAQKQAEQALRESEERFRVLVTATAQAVWETDADGVVVADSPSWRAYTGQTLQEWLGCGWLDAIHPDDREDAEAQWRQAVAERHSFNVDLRLRTPHGQWRWTNLRVAPSCNPAGKVLKWIGMNMDITGRKDAEQALRDGERRLETVLESTPAAVVLINAATRRFSYMNRRALALYGSDYVGVDLATHAAAVHAQRPDGTPYPLDEMPVSRSLHARETVYGEEMIIHRADGSSFTLSVNSAPLCNEHGEIDAAIAAFDDISARRRAEEALREADRQKNRFLSLLGHELRNPLSAISNTVAVLEMGGSSEGEIRQAVHLIERQVRHLVRLVDDLLNLNRISRGQVELRRVPLDLTESIRDALAQAQSAIDAGGEHLDLDLPEEPLPVEGDRERLTQILTNLLVNAAVYAGDGSSIGVSAKLAGDRVLVRVRDNGVGIAAEDLPRLFEPFTRLQAATSRQDGGLGLGLALARELAELHEGTLEAHSDGPGHGSEFTLTLPLLRGNGARDIEPAPAHPPVQIARRRVLVADDDPAVGEALVTLLERLGQDVRLVTRGNAVEKAVEAFRPALVILDIGLPDMSGVEIARRLRASPGSQAFRIVALSGYGQNSTEPSELACFDRYLLKPATVEQLKALLSEA
jgi:two-component system CheB/CheR fusion protein